MEVIYFLKGHNIKRLDLEGSKIYLKYRGYATGNSLEVNLSKGIPTRPNFWDFNAKIR